MAQLIDRVALKAKQDGAWLLAASSGGATYSAALDRKQFPGQVVGGFYVGPVFDSTGRLMASLARFNVTQEAA